MSEGETLLLGFIAGVTILLGLPLGRMRARRVALRQFLNALATGILLFLVWDVLSHAWEPIDAALASVHNGEGEPAKVLGYSLLFFGGLGVGLLGLVYYEQWFRRHYRRSDLSLGQDAKRLCSIIAMGIGLHNFGEGLAIGASAAAGELGLATVLVIGFALHNATEGFGIVAPLAAAEVRPSWGFLMIMGLVGGGPTFVGTAIGSQFTNEAVSTLFLTLAAGSILYVVLQLVNVAHRIGRIDLMHWGLFLGLLAGFATDMVVTAGGA